MPGTMKVQPFDTLLRRILQEYETTQSIFGIHRSLFYTPRSDSPYALPDLYGQPLATPIGPAAGPHTQLSQNIISAWLCGGRFIELKTVQIMDELEIPRPCIDMEDEGYNVEWSQELKLEQSVREYVNAWAAIHVLRRLLGWEETPFGTIFNLSVGYNLAGVRDPRMTCFMDRLVDASADLAEIKAVLREQFPRFADVEIPSRLVNSVTLSTMHGCPPDEIELIARYLLQERGLHTIVKLNPTLLGKERVLGILHDSLGFTEIHIPDAVFEHDLQYDRAVALIRALQQTAAAQGLTFSVKLSNTLAMRNHKGHLAGAEMYMSGRALYPVTMNLFSKLAHDFGGDLRVSYSAGADALNVATILSCGARPVTAASDLLKPGGYARFGQWLENLEEAMRARAVASLDELAPKGNRLTNLEQAAAEALVNPRYQKHYSRFGLPKVASGLGVFDCIAAPCVEQCAVAQDVPTYARLIARGYFDRALEVILARNPLPGVTGYICTHLCQTRCTRNSYDEAVAIRALKRFAAQRGKTALHAAPATGRKVAVIGSGPSGLAAAACLALNGVQVTVFEARDQAGGMLSLAPTFRLPRAVVQEDVERITALGVEIVLSHPIAHPPEELLQGGYDAVYIASGFQKDAHLEIEGAQSPGVYSALDLLERVARGEKPDLGHKVLVIGGGNTAMDAARTAQRLTGQPVTVVYRRTRAEMPCTEEELADLLDEGNCLLELASPVRVIRQGGRVAALECQRNRLGEPGSDGRREPLPVHGSEFRMEADAIIVAVGQKPDVAFLDGSGVTLRKSGALAVDPLTGLAAPRGLYAGGDAARGPAIVIQACADGRRAAEAICARFGMSFDRPPAHTPQLMPAEILAVKRARARKQVRQTPALLSPALRKGWDLIEHTLSEEQARLEAARCLQCSTLCDKCVEVCPNRANRTYFTAPVQCMLPQLACRDGRLVVTGCEPFRVEQARQIVHVADFCNECGNCATFCVHQGKPYADKPRLFLDEAAFDRADENAFHIEGQTICRREGSQESQLTGRDGLLTFENAQVRVSLTPAFQVQQMTLKQPFEGTLSLKDAAEMALLLAGVSNSLPFLIIHQEDSHVDR